MKKNKEEQLGFNFEENFEQPKNIQNNKENPDKPFCFSDISKGLNEKQKQFDEGDPNGVDVKSKIKGLRDMLKKKR